MNTIGMMYHQRRVARVAVFMGLAPELVVFVAAGSNNFSFPRSAWERL
jgi:hypothetical protein